MSDLDERRRYQAILKDWLDVEVPTALLMSVVEAQYLDEWAMLATIPREGRKHTSAKAARELCAVASVCLARNHPLPDVVREYLARALHEIAEGKSADVALKVRQGKTGVSRDAMDQIQKERMIAYFMKHLIGIDGLSPARAKESACEQFIAN